MRFSRLTFRKQNTHSPGFRGRRSASKGEGRSRHDFPLLHAVGSSDQLQNNANNIKGLAFYHEIRWSLEFAAIPVYIFGVQETGRENVRLCVGAPGKPRTVFS